MAQSGNKQKQWKQKGENKQQIEQSETSLIIQMRSNGPDESNSHVTSGLGIIVTVL